MRKRQKWLLWAATLTTLYFMNVIYIKNEGSNTCGLYSHGKSPQNGVVGVAALLPLPARRGALA